MTPEVLEISGCPMYLPCMGSDLDEKGLEDATPAHQCVDRFLFPPVEPSQTLEILSGSSGTGAHPMPSKLFTDEVVHCGIVIEMETREIFPEAIGHYAGVHTTTTQLGQLDYLFFCCPLI